MKTKLLFFLLLLAGQAFGTISVTGNLQDLTGTAVTSGSFVRFYMRGCNGNQPFVSGVALIAPTSGALWFKDFLPNGSGAISGTLYATTDVSCGGSTSVIWYGMVVFVNGKAGPESAVSAAGNININNPTLITTAPVIPVPTGDTTYLRLDGTNSPETGGVTFTGNNTFTGQNSFTAYKLNSTLFVDGLKYTTVQAAINALPGSGGTVMIPCGSFTGPTTIPSNTALVSICSGENAQTVGNLGVTPLTAQSQTVLTYASTLTLTGIQNVLLQNITMDFGNGGGGLVLTGASFNQFRYLTINKAGNNSTVALLIQPSGSASANNSVDNTFDHLRVNCSTTNSQYCLAGIQLFGQGAVNAGGIVTHNKFFETFISGAIKGCLDFELNSDSNYFWDVTCNFDNPSPPAGSYYLGFNLTTPASDQDADGSIVQGFLAAGNAPTSFIRAGQSNGQIITISNGSSGLPSITVTGGAFQPSYLGTISLPSAVSANVFGGGLGVQEQGSTNCQAGYDFFTGNSSSHTLQLCNNGGSAGDVIYTGSTKYIPAYNIAGSQLLSFHIVNGVNTLSTGTRTVTLSGAAVFGNASSYVCVANDNTAANPIEVTYGSGSSVTFTGTGSDAFTFTCSGN